MNRTFLGLSLFSGAGGLDLGLRQAGFGVAACVEADPHCCSTLRTTMVREKSSSAVIESDIRKIEPAKLRRELGVKKGELDLLFGGPPCQTFSQIGKQHGLRDARGLLLFEVARFASEFRPKVILLEQVKGLLSGTGPTGYRGEVFAMFLDSLRELGYSPKYQVMLAADFGVAQLRQRVFVVATKQHNGFVYPEPTHGPMEEHPGLFALPSHRVVGDVLGGLGCPEIKVRGQKTFRRNDNHIDVTPERDRERIHYVPEGSFLAAQSQLSKSLVGNLKAKDTTKYLRLNRRKPSNTLRCGEIFYHPTEDRYLTPREYMRIHGYPDDYKLEGPVRSRTGTVKNLDQHRQVANSVPPPMARILGSRILEYLDANANR